MSSITKFYRLPKATKYIDMMNLRTTDVTRIASRIGTIRHASTRRAFKTRDEPVKKKQKSITPPVPPPEGLGRNIYVYSHLQTKQVVYSLHRVLNNHNTLQQLPYNGKKTVPSVLRKDLWYPMANIRFSKTPRTSQIGLVTFQKLREYRKMHELLWPKEEMEGLTKKSRGRKIMNQRANTVADMAAALAKVMPVPKTEAEAQEEETVEKSTKGRGLSEESEEAAAVKKHILYIKGVPGSYTDELLLGKMASMGLPTPTSVTLRPSTSSIELETAEDAARVTREMKGVALKENSRGLQITSSKPTKKVVQKKVDEGAEGLTVVIKWTDILDAEYAESWPQNVVHDEWVPNEKRQSGVRALELEPDV